MALIEDFKARKRALQEGFVHYLEGEALEDTEYTRRYFQQLRPNSQVLNWHSRVLKETYFDAMGTSMIVTDPEDIVRLWNAEAEKPLGYSAREAIGFSLHFLGVFAIPGIEYSDEEKSKKHYPAP